MKRQFRQRSAQHLLYREAEGIAAMSNVTDSTKDVVAALVNQGPWREVVLVPDDFQTRCARLRRDFPNFEPYINDVLIPDLALCHRSGRPINLTPVLFLGSPGIGKTLFSGELAACMGMPFERMNLETAQASFEIVGVARGWSSSGPGRLMRWVAEAGPVNGLFAFEELDKEAADKRFPASAAMLQLLEKSTASRFADRAVPELKLDLQSVNYVFTANSLEGISQPLLSRLLVIQVPELTVGQARSIIQRQYRSLLISLDLLGDAPELSEDALLNLSQYSPRRQRLLLKLALGRALHEGASKLTVPAQDQSQRPRMGFY